MKIGIHRKRYLDRITPFIDKDVIKVFTGQRRVGKSYMLFQVIDVITQMNPDANIIYINMEDLVNDSLRDIQVAHSFIHKKKKLGKNYLFIDEIQEITDFQKLLRSLILDPDFDVYCTGSNAKMMSSDIAGLLSGRFVEFTIYSLAYEEFLLFHQLSDNDKNLEKFLKYGGLPYLKNLPLNDEVVFEYIKNIYNTIIYRDVVNRHAIRNSVFLERLIQYLASTTGSLFSAKKISDYLKSQMTTISPLQVQNYLGHLTDAFIVHQTPRYDIVGKRLFEIGNKFYFENLGIRNGIWGYRIEDRGKIIENVVHNHLLYCGYEVKIGVIGNNEVDFVADKNGERIYIQVALMLNEENTIAREFGNLLKINDQYSKYVVSLDQFTGNTYQGIEHLNLRDFLLRYVF